jgi:hypothetical protein
MVECHFVLCPSDTAHLVIVALRQANRRLLRRALFLSRKEDDDPYWDHHVRFATVELWEAVDTLIVIGYSFPPSDTLARSAVLQHSKAKRVKVVVGRNSQGNDIKAMFDRKMVNGTTNTGLLTQEFLCEGTISPLPSGRFNYYKFR